MPTQQGTTVPSASTIKNRIGIEQPVALVGDQTVNADDLALMQVQARADHIRMTGVGDDHFGD